MANATVNQWTQRILSSSQNWQSVAYGNGVFVAIAVSTSVAATSPDGITWTQRALPSSQIWTSITYGNGLFVVVSGGSGVAATSPDGITWTQRVLPFPQYAVVYGGGLFVAVAKGSSVAATSPDGIAWTQRVLPSSQQWQSIAYGSGLFVAVAAGPSSAAAISLDGITWTPSVLPSSQSWQSIAYGGGLFVVVATGTSFVATSPDGITWTQRVLPSVQSWYSVAYGNGLFVAIAAVSSAAAISLDGITWTPSVLPSSQSWQSIAYGGGLFVVVVSGANVAALVYVTNVVSAGTTYRYLFTDVVTGATIGELNMTGVTFDQKLNTPGTLNAHILLDGINTAALNVNASTIPMRCAIHVDRNGTIIWGGVIWARSYDSKTQILTITAREWLSYFERRKITNTIAFTAIDQMAVAQQLVQNAQSVPNGNVKCLYNVDPLSTTTSGTTITQTYYSYELKTVFTEIQALSQQAGGFDYAIDCYYEGGGNIAKSFNTYYPRRGIAYSSTLASVPVFELPSGNVISYNFPEDGSLAANTVYIQGAGSNEGKLIATASDTAKYTAGWPLLEDALTYNNITDPAVLAKLATGKLNSVSYPPTTLTLIAPPYQDPYFGTYRVGDDVRVRITDQRFPSGSDATYRIVALAVQAGEKQPERVTLTLAQSGTSI